MASKDGKVNCKDAAVLYWFYGASEPTRGLWYGWLRQIGS